MHYIFLAWSLTQNFISSTSLPEKFEKHKCTFPESQALSRILESWVIRDCMFPQLFLSVNIPKNETARKLGGLGGNAIPTKKKRLKEKRRAFSINYCPILLSRKEICVNLIQSNHSFVDIWNLRKCCFFSTVLPPTVFFCMI